MDDIFRLCSTSPDKYLCVSDIDVKTHRAALVSIHPTSSLTEVKKLAAEGYTILYSTPRGGYIVVSDFDSEFVVGQVYVRFNVLSLTLGIAMCICSLRKKATTCMTL